MPVRTATLPQPAEPVPIPPAATGVPAVTAEHVVDIPMDGAAPGLNILEGLAFDRAGTLYLCNTPMGRIFAVDLRTRSVRLLCQLPQGLMPSAIKLHRDGRLFATCVVNGTGGCLAVLSPEGELLDRLVENEGHLFDDMVFDARGGIYLTDLGGSIANPTSGVWYLAPGAREPHQMAGGMVSSNGIALAPDGNALWVTEYGRGLLHWIELGREPGRVEAVGSRIPYRFSGLEGPDSACIDAGASMLTLHARTRGQMYSGKADWDKIRILKDHVRGQNAAVFASGDIFCGADALEVMTRTGCDGVMFARGAIGNPFIFRQTELAAKGIDWSADVQVRISTLIRHLDYMIEDSGEAKAVREMRKHAMGYLKGLEGASKAKAAINSAMTRDDYLRALEAVESAASAVR